MPNQETFCTQCEAKTSTPSDMGFCAWCFDAQEEEDRLQEVNA
jgi:hypothetical protein